MADQDTKQAAENEDNLEPEEKETEKAKTPEEEKAEAKKEFQETIDKIAAEDPDYKKDDDKKDKKEEKPPKDKKEEPADDTLSEGDEGAEDDKGKKKDDEKISIPNSLKDRAVRAGMSSEEVSEYTSEDMLIRIVDGLERAAVAEAKLKAEAQGSEKSGEGEEGEEDPLSKIDLESYDEDTRADMEVLISSLKGQNAVIEELKEQLQSSKENSQLGFLDQKIASLGKDYEDILGKGYTADLPAGNERNARAKLERHMNKIRELAKEDGETISEESVFDLGLNSAFPARVKELKTKEAAAASRKRSKKVVARAKPTESGASDVVDRNLTDEDRERLARQAISQVFAKAEER